MRSRTGANKIKIAIVEDEPLYRELLVRALEHEDSFEVVGSFSNPDQAFSHIVSIKPDAVLLDIELKQNINGMDLGIKLRHHLPHLGVVLLSNHRVASVLSSIPKGEAGGWCYLLKDSVRDIDTLQRTIRGAVGGMVILDPRLVMAAEAEPETDLSQLTPRQLQTLQLMAKGLTNRAIAERLGISIKSVENHSNQLYQQLGVDRSDKSIQPRVYAVIKYIEQSDHC